MYQTPDTLFTAEFMGSNNRMPGKVLQRDGARVTLQVEGGTVQATARGSNLGNDVTGIIRLEQVKISDHQTDNAIRLPLSTCMYLGDRWECLFKAGGVDTVGLRAYAPHKLEQGDYWLSLPQESLWAF